MKENIKISVSVTIVFSISFLILFSFLYGFEILSQNIQKQELSLNQDVKKVILMGSSTSMALNSTKITEVLEANDLSAYVIHRGSNADQPTKRINYIDDIVKLDPSVVVYSLAFRDLEFNLDLWWEPLENLPKCRQLTSETQTEFNYTNPEFKEQDHNFTYPSFLSLSPKHVTIQIIQQLFEEKNDDLPKTDINNTNFKKFPIDKITEKTESWGGNPTDINLLSIPNKKDYSVCINDVKNELDSLKQIIQIFQQNDIDVILYVPPYTKGYFYSLPEFVENFMIFSLEHIAKEHNIDFYNLSHRYEEQNIFRDHEHVVKNNVAAIFSIDVAKMILNLNDDNSNTLKIIDVATQKLSNTDLRFSDFRYADLSYKDFTNSDLSGSNFFGSILNNTVFVNADLTHTIFTGVNLDTTNLEGADLRYSDFASTQLNALDFNKLDLTGVNLSEVDLSGKDFTNTILINADLSNSNLSSTSLSNLDLTGVNLSEVDLSGKDFTNTILINADLSNSNLSYSNLNNLDLSRTILNHVNFTGANLSNVSLFKNTQLKGILLHGANMTNSNLSEINLSPTLDYAVIHDRTGTFIGLDLGASNLSNVILTNATLFNSTLNSVRLDYSDLSNANFSDVRMINGSITHSNVTNADFTHSEFSVTNFSYSDFTNTDFSFGDLRKANFTHTNLNNTNFDNTNLRGTIFD